MLCHRTCVAAAAPQQLRMRAALDHPTARDGRPLLPDAENVRKYFRFSDRLFLNGWLPNKRQPTLTERVSRSDDCLEENQPG